jgi:hypothetical protein
MGIRSGADSARRREEKRMGGEGEEKGGIAKNEFRRK